MISFLRSQQRYSDLAASARDAAEANLRIKVAFETGRDVNFNQWFNIARLKRDQDELAAQVEGDIPTALIQLYRALGGGWQIRLGAHCPPPAFPPAPAPLPTATLPVVRDYFPQ